MGTEHRKNYKIIYALQYDPVFPVC